MVLISTGLLNDVYFVLHALDMLHAIQRRTRPNNLLTNRLILLGSSFSWYTGYPEFVFRASPQAFETNVCTVLPLGYHSHFPNILISSVI
jgi:hypothetical protein